MPGMGGTTESKPAMAADESFLSKTHIKQTAAKKASVEHGERRCLEKRKISQVHVY